MNHADSLSLSLIPKTFCIGIYPINNIVIVSGEQWRNSAICIHISILPLIPLCPGWHITLSRVPCVYNKFLLVICFKYSIVYMTFPKSLTIPSPWQPWVCFLSLWVSFCFVSKFICIILDSTHKGCHMIFLLCVTYFTQYTLSRSIYVAANGLISFFLMAG